MSSVTLFARASSRLPLLYCTTTTTTTPRTQRYMTTTNISGGSMGRAWADKEHAAENQYFSKQDAENLTKLAAKLHQHTQPTEQVLAKEKEFLMSIFGKHSVTPSDALIEDLLKFKFNRH